MIPSDIVTTRKGDFLLIERSSRPECCSLYRQLSVTGRTLTTEEFLSMATSMMDVRGTPTVVTDVDVAIDIVTTSGWVVLEFRN